MPPFTMKKTHVKDATAHNVSMMGDIKDRMTSLAVVAPNKSKAGEIESIGICCVLASECVGGERRHDITENECANGY